MGARNNNGTPQRIEWDLKSHKALELRRQHKTFEQIAVELGYSNSHASYTAVMRLLKRLPAESLQEFRDIELRRLEAKRAHWEQFATGEAHDMWLKFSDRIYRVLGIPSKHEITGKDGVPLPAPNVNIKVDFSVLSDDELQSYRSILSKLRSRSGAGMVESGNGTLPAEPA